MKLKDLEIEVFRVKGALDTLEECPELDRDKLRTIAKLRGLSSNALEDNVG